MKKEEEKRRRMKSMLLNMEVCSLIIRDGTGE